MLSRILVPYHVDEPQPDLDWPLPAETVITAAPDAPAETRPFLGALYDGVGDAVADRVAGGTVPVVLSGDCTTSLGTPPEVEYLAPAAITRVSVADVSTMEPPAGPMYLHLDLDVLSPEALPGLLFPAPGGPDLREVFQAVRAVVATGRVAAVGVACTWHPGHNAAAIVRPHLETALAISSS